MGALGRPDLAEPGKDRASAVCVGIRMHVGHRVDGERDVEAEFIALTGGRLDAYAAGDPGRSRSVHCCASQPRFEVRADDCPQVRW